MDNVQRTIANDLLMENEIMKTVENVKLKNLSYTNIFKENFITQSTIHVNLNKEKLYNQKLDLFRIFNNFLVNKDYPFLQYQTPDGRIVFKMNTCINIYSSKEILTKWFETTSYGIGIKVRIPNSDIRNESEEGKFIGININENGRIEYKVQKKETDKATIEDIRKTYDYIRNLVKKIKTSKSTKSVVCLQTTP